MWQSGVKCLHVRWNGYLNILCKNAASPPMQTANWIDFGYAHDYSIDHVMDVFFCCFLHHLRSSLHSIVTIISKKSAGFRLSSSLYIKLIYMNTNTLRTWILMPICYLPSFTVCFDQCQCNVCSEQVFVFSLCVIILQIFVSMRRQILMNIYRLNGNRFNCIIIECILHGSFTINGHTRHTHTHQTPRN